ncbi:MAG: flagellar basal body L-ring protein FlgH [Pseudomonadota bacterium]
MRSTSTFPSRLSKCALWLVASLSLGACGATLERVKNIGRAPALTPIGDVSAPEAESSIGAPLAVQTRPNLAVRQVPPTFSQGQAMSLWRTGARSFFRDQRANQVGDILTVKIAISDSAQVDNTTSRTRANSEDAGLDNLFGLESKLNSFLPNAVDPTSLVKGKSNSSSVGTGEVQRSEDINLTVAAIVTKLLPNGNLMIQGRQEVRVNFEMRELVIVGIVRPQDIAQDNTIKHTQIAEARISYGGRGQLTDVQQARYGQQLFDALFPF